MSSSWLPGGPGFDEGGNVQFNIVPPAGSRAAEYGDVINAVPEFIANELLGIDDARRAFGYAREGNWGSFAKSLLGFAAEGGLTALSLLAAPVTGGASVAARVGAAGGRAGLRGIVRGAGRRGAGRAATSALPPGVTRRVVSGYPSYTGTFQGVTRPFVNVPLRADALGRATRYAATGQSGLIRGARATMPGRRLLLGNRRVLSPIVRAGVRSGATSAYEDFWTPMAEQAAEEAAPAPEDTAAGGGLSSDLIDELFGPQDEGAGAGGGVPGIGDYTAAADRLAEMLPLGPTEQELAYLNRQLERLDAFQRAGDIALESGWATIEKANYAAAEKAVRMGAVHGEDAKRIWSEIAQDARTIVDARGQAAAQEGGFSYQPTAAAGDWSGLTGVIGQSEEDLAVQRAATTARDLEWLGATAASTGQALRGGLQNAIVRAKADEAKQFNQMILERDARRQETIASAMFNAEMAGLNAQASGASSAAAPVPGSSQAQFASYVANLVDTVGVEGATRILIDMGFPPDEAQFWADQSAAAAVG